MFDEKTPAIIDFDSCSTEGYNISMVKRTDEWYDGNTVFIDLCSLMSGNPERIYGGHLGRRPRFPQLINVAILLDGFFVRLGKCLGLNPKYNGSAALHMGYTTKQMKITRQNEHREPMGLSLFRHRIEQHLVAIRLWSPSSLSLIPSSYKVWSFLTNLPPCLG